MIKPGERIKKKSKHKFPLNSTWMTDSRPGNKTPGVKFSVESDFQVKNKHCLRPEGKNKEKRNLKGLRGSQLGGSQLYKGPPNLKIPPPTPLGAATLP